MEKEKSDLEKSAELIENAGHKVVHGLSLSGHDYIKDICDLLGNAGYRVVSAKALCPTIGGWNRWDGQLGRVPTMKI